MSSGTRSPGHYDAAGTAPKPPVENHAVVGQYVNCKTGAAYVWVDETDANPVPNSIYNNDAGFTHDYYSGTTALATDPTRCLGVTNDAWRSGGPVTRVESPDLARRATERAIGGQGSVASSPARRAFASPTDSAWTCRRPPALPEGSHSQN